VSRVRPLAWMLLAAGVGLLALSFVLDPTPTTHVLEHGRRVTVHHDGAVDYAITASRLAGIALLIAGAYLGYRSVRPDVVRPTTDCRRRISTATPAPPRPFRATPLVTAGSSGDRSPCCRGRGPDPR